MTDLVLIHPGTAPTVYGGDLASDLVAVEPPVWSRIIAGYVQDRQFSVHVIDAEAEGIAPYYLGARVAAISPRLACVVAYGHQPSASTQQMDVAAQIAAEIKRHRCTPTMVVGGHVAALPAETLRDMPAFDYACSGEGPETVVGLLRDEDVRGIKGLVWRGPDGVRVNPSAKLLDMADLHGDVWDKLPMARYRAHNWQCFGDLSSRQPYASIHTSLGCPYKCLAGDTMINTMIGDFPIRDLAEKFGDDGVPVYTYDVDTKRVLIQQGVRIKKYGANEKMVRVSFDDGTHIDVTPDHEFLQFKWGNGKSPSKQWPVQARDLEPGAHVRAIKFERHPTGRVYVAWGRRDKAFRSRMVMEFMLRRQLRRDEHVHHIDHDVGNDHPSNLKHCASAAEHFAEHPEIAERMRADNPTRGGVDDEWRENIGVANRGKVRSMDARRHYRESKLGERNPNYRHGKRTGAKSRLEVNHRVVSVEPLADRGDVYCLTVPSTGWFFANNVLVKNCSFCCINAPFGTNKYRMREPWDVAAEVGRLHQQYGVRTLKFVDEMFVLNEAHYTEICRLLAEMDLDLNIWAYARVDTVKAGKLALLRRAGIRWLALGIESASAYVRDGSNKRLKSDDIAEVVRAIKAAGINVIGNFIFGLPDDTTESMRSTLDLAEDLNCEFANFYSAMAYPGSPLWHQAVAGDYQLPTTWSGYSQHSFDCQPLGTDHVSPADVLRFRDEAFHRYFTAPRYLDMVGEKFGQATVDHVRGMTAHRLRRRLLGHVEEAA